MDSTNFTAEEMEFIMNCLQLYVDEYQGTTQFSENARIYNATYDKVIRIMEANNG